MNRLRGGWKSVTLYLLLLILSVFSLEAQVRREMGRTTRSVDPLGADEAESFLQDFRSSRGGMDSIFEGRLIHYPRRGDKMTLPVTLYSGWDGPVLKIRIEVGDDPLLPTDRLLFQGGPDPKGWSWTLEDGVVPLPPEDLLQPVLPQLDLTAFDLTAPYLDWPGTYDRSERVSDSPAHWFRFEPPNDAWQQILSEGGIVSVRVALDARFNAPVRVEYLDSWDGVLRSLEVRSFKKVKDTWIVRRLEAFDEVSRDRTELRIDDSSVELTLPRDIYLPDSLSEPVVSIEGQF
ncbi:MAG: hypothetical protein ACQKBT_10665 [Puniceicoccales bacterium]